jgi:hypothetical protein
MLGCEEEIKKRRKRRNKEKKWNWAFDLVKAQFNFYWAFEQ